MAKAVMMVYGIDQIDQVVREAARRGNRSGFGQPSSCNSPRVAPEACHDPSPWRSASRLHSTVPAVTTQSGAVAHPECPGQSELPHVALQEGAARPAAGRSASAPPQKRRGRPPKAGGEFFCPRCNESRGSLETLNNSHFKEYEITKRDGSKEKRRLCVIMDAKVRSLFAHFCSLFMLTFCSRFSHVFCSRFCSSFAQLYTDLLTFYSLSTTRLIGHKAAQGDGEDAATACWAGHAGVHAAGGARGRY